MRRKIVAGNWKMNMDMDSGYDLVRSIIRSLPEISGAEVILAPPFPFLAPVAKMLQNHDSIKLAAQNCHHEGSGAYTGEVSAAMLASFGVSNVILGHSERRQYFGETDAIISKKIDNALTNGVDPIYCFGETLEQRDSGNHFKVVTDQISEALNDYPNDRLDNLVIAYEPVWAIGTGLTATPDQAQEIHQHVRSLMTTQFGPEGAGVRILYGGSCKPGNAAELFAQPDIDGGLIGGASLNADDFLGIIKACST